VLIFENQRVNSCFSTYLVGGGTVENVRTMGAYEVRKKLGEGDVGTYYLGQHLASEDYVILEELYEKYAQDDNFEKRYKRELEASKLLDNDHILKVLEFGRTENSIYVASEYPKGLRLSELLEKTSKLPLDVTCSIIHQTVEGLKEVHSRGIVHRNLKPVFLFLSQDGTVKIADFGLAQGEELGPIFISKKQLGTAYYLSSELASGKKVDHRSDIFSLGIIFYEMLSGFNPFKADDFTTIVRNVQRLEPKPLSEANPNIPPNVSNVVQKMLQKDRNQRYMNVSQIITDLDAAANKNNITPDKSVVAKYLQDYVEPLEGEKKKEEKRTMSPTPPPPPQPEPEEKGEEDLIDFGGEEQPTPTAPETPAEEDEDLFAIDLDSEEEAPAEPTPSPKEESFPDLFGGEESEIPEPTPTEKPKPEPEPEDSQGPVPLHEPDTAELSFAELNEDLPQTEEEAPESTPESEPEPEPPKPPEPKPTPPQPTPSPEPEAKPTEPVTQVPEVKEEEPFMTEELEMTLFGPKPKMPKSTKPVPTPTPSQPAETTPPESDGTKLGAVEYTLIAAIVVLLLGFVYIAFFMDRGNYGSIRVEATPADAMVLLNGIVQAKETPCVIENIRAGSHSVEVMKKGKPTYKVQFPVEGGKQHLVKVDLNKLETEKSPSKMLAQKEDKTIWVITEPPGAVVYMDGNPLQGLTPLKTNVSMGAHTVSIRLGGFKEHSTDFNLTTEKIDTLNVVLQPIGGAEELAAEEPTETTPEEPELRSEPIVLDQEEEKEPEAARIVEPPKPDETVSPPETEETPTADRGTDIAEPKEPEMQLPSESVVVPEVVTANFPSTPEIIERKAPSEMAKLDVKVSFWADIFLDDEYKGVTPLVKPILVEPGNRVVKIIPSSSEEAFKPLEKTVYLKKGETVIIKESDFKKK
jgi:serine/threonine protein kinase